MALTSLFLVVLFFVMRIEEALAHLKSYCKVSISTGLRQKFPRWGVVFRLGLDLRFWAIIPGTTTGKIRFVSYFPGIFQLAFLLDFFSFEFSLKRMFASVRLNFLYLLHLFFSPFDRETAEEPLRFYFFYNISAQKVEGRLLVFVQKKKTTV